MGWRAALLAVTASRLQASLDGAPPRLADGEVLPRASPSRQAVAPRVRVVVVNHNGGDRTIDCLRSVERTAWPEERLDVVLVDNDPSDGTAVRTHAELPRVRVVSPGANLGFAGGCNAGLNGLDGADYVAFLNNDVTVDPGWLRPLVETLEDDPTVGAVSPKILFADSYVDVFIASPTGAKGMGDRRPLGVRLSGVRLDGEDAWSRLQLVGGFWGREFGSGQERLYQWTSSRAHMRVPVRRDGALPQCEVRLTADGERTVQITSGPNSVQHRVTRSPAWFAVPLGGEPFDVVNNVGSTLLRGGYGVDRGYLERDAGQFETSQEVFAWCGAAVLVSRRYLEDVGRFEDRMFLYYEDFDMSWRGRIRGWRYVYVPRSVVRHVHAASAVVGSRLHDHHVERNRLLTLLRNAPPSLALGAAARHLLITGSYLRRDVLSPLFHGQPTSPETVRRRLAAFADYARLSPAMLATRWGVRRRAVARDQELLAWMRDAPENALPVAELAHPSPTETPWQRWYAFRKERAG